MALSDRIRDKFEEWATDIAHGVGRFCVLTFGKGIETFADILGKALKPVIMPVVDSVLAKEGVPPEIKEILERIKTDEGQWQAMLGGAVGYTAIGGVVNASIFPPLELFKQFMSRDTRFQLLGVAEALNLWRRGAIDEEKLFHELSSVGYPDTTIYALQRLTDILFDPNTATQLWLRDRALYEWIWNDLRKQGYTESQIENIKELADIIPPLADMVRFADFGAFDPEIIALWREYYDAPSWITEPMAKIGISGEWANKYWFSHWRQPGRFELGELHRRGLIDDDIVKNAYLTQGFTSYWQDRLLELVKEVPTRVDVRRFWDMATIDEERLREIYHAQGYYGKDLDDYVLWTKVYVAFPDLVARWKNGWISIEEVNSELVALGMPEDRAQELIETKFKKVEEERVVAERDLTKADIVKAVKKEVIDWYDGLDLLMDLGYSNDEAWIILLINIETSTGSPESYVAFKEITQAYRRAIGKSHAAIPEELKVVTSKIQEIAARLQQTKEKGDTPETITLIEEELSNARDTKNKLLEKYRPR